MNDYDTTSEIESAKRDGEVIKAICPICKTRTNHKIVSSVRQNWEVIDVIRGIYDLLIIQCAGCDNLQFSKESSDDETYRTEVVDGREVEVLVLDQKFYPEINTDFSPVRNYRDIPMHVKTLYEETYASLVTGNVYLSGAGVRAIVEAICNSNKITSGSLKSKIDKLHTQGIVTQATKDMLHSLRIFGNSSIHSNTKFKYHELVNAWDAIDYLMVSIYGTGSVNSMFEWNRDADTPF